ncbi:MAG: hypothetical protein AB1721_01725 [Patescibacteria group bacterium]
MADNFLFGSRCRSLAAAMGNSQVGRDLPAWLDSGNAGLCLAGQQKTQELSRVLPGLIYDKI